MQWLSVGEDLGIDNIDTCVGYARSRNRRCRSPTSPTFKYWACAILERISENGIQWEQLTHGHLEEYVFEELAVFLLCSRHHRDQKHSIIAGWKQRALARERERISQEVRALETTVETITTMIESVSLAAQQPISERVSSSTELSGGEASISLPESDALNAPRPDAASSSSRRSITSLDHDSGSRYLHSSYRSNSIWPQIHAASSSNRQATTSHNHYPRSTGLHYSYMSNFVGSHIHDATSYMSNPSPVGHYTSLTRAAIDAPSYISNHSPIGHSTSPRPAVITRDSTNSNQTQPLEEVETLCPICLDSFEETRTLTRCNSCLQEFHEDCISTWLEHQEDRNRNTYGTCPCCRMVWDGNRRERDENRRERDENRRERDEFYRVPPLMLGTGALRSYLDVRSWDL